VKTVANKEDLRAVRDLYTSLYASNETYHQAKEQMVWFAANAYLVLIVAVTGFLFANPNPWKGLKLPFSVGLLLISLVSTVFAGWQNMLKVSAVIKHRGFNKLLPRMGTDKEPTGAHLLSVMEAWGRMCFGQKCAQGWKNGWPGWLFVILMLLLTFAVPALVFHFDP
jgi:hypothetical protein